MFTIENLKFQAFLELLSNGKRFRVAEHDVSMISNILVPDVNTIVLDVSSANLKIQIDNFIDFRFSIRQLELNTLSSQTSGIEFIK